MMAVDICPPALPVPEPVPEPGHLKHLLRSGPSADAVAMLFPLKGAARLAVERVHFPRARPVQFQVRAQWGSGQSGLLLAEWAGDRAADMARDESRRLAKPQRRQTADGPVVVADPATGLLLRRPGFDTKLPGLRMLHDPAWAADRLASIGLDPASVVTLVAHRLGKRAVLRIDGRDGTRFARLRPITSASGQQAYDRHMALWAAMQGTWQGTGQLSIPRPLGFDGDIGLALFDRLAGTPPVFHRLAGFRATAAVMRATAALQSLAVAAPGHAAADELALLDDWTARLDPVFPDLAARMMGPLHRLREQMSALPAISAVLCHRDLHEGQILLQDGQAGLLDFDTLRMGDPALDAGNLQAHLILASCRDGVSRRAFVTAIDNALPQVSLSRIALWRRAALLRLATIYAFSAEPREVIHALIGEAA